MNGAIFLKKLFINFGTSHFSKKSIHLIKKDLLSTFSILSKKDILLLKRSQWKFDWDRLQIVIAENVCLSED